MMGVRTCIGVVLAALVVCASADNVLRFMSRDSLLRENSKVNKPNDNIIVASDDSSQSLKKVQSGDLQSLKNLVKSDAVICPGREVECSDGQTCCKLRSGEWGCCPFPNAECCDDGEHCCPQGFTCDVPHQKCNKGDLSIPMEPKRGAQPMQVVCPDQSSCPNGETCCQLASGDYGCCPEPNAVCCDDHVHCCPQGTTCDEVADKCVSGTISIPWQLKRPATKPQQKVENIVCPDGSSCPDGSTCCALSSGQYGCCPQPNAVCCSDHLHCCPEGYTCDVAAGTCNQGAQSTPFLAHTPQDTQPKLEDVVCPDGSSCPDGSTCCALSSGQYGCCPQPNAVCCSDHLHCCPEGYKCDVAAGTCTKGAQSTPFLAHTPQDTQRQSTNLVCPDKTECTQAQTCCQLSSGKYGCCPEVQAVCCTDQENCCPHGFTCNLQEGTCVKGGLSLPLLKKLPAIYRRVEIVVCPDQQSQCPDGSTCCQLASGQYGCCPMPLAVCCSDHAHCCPQGYTCDVKGGTCKQGSLSIPWVQKLPATSASEAAQPVTDIVCPDQSRCTDDQTCCQLASGDYGCCPMPKATCCSDQEHCCPNGYTCDVQAATCNKGNLSVHWEQKLAARRFP